MASYGCGITCLYVDDIRTSQEAHLQVSTACYGDGFICLYVEDVRTSQEAHLCYGDSLTFYFMKDEEGND
jgi:hypothetical protein